ncbi:hypothetical protein RQN30_00840 [Arcanobacterium hippocoleae]
MDLETAEGVNSPFWMFEIGGRALPAGTKIIYHYFGADAAVRLTQTQGAGGGYSWEPRTVLYAFGQAQAGVRELAKIAAEFTRPEMVMIDRRIYKALPPELKEFYGPYWGKGWEFFYAASPLADVPETGNVVRLKAGSMETISAISEIERVLRASIKETHALHEMEKFDWFVHRLADGRITAAMGAEDDHLPDPGAYLSSVGVDLREILDTKILPAISGRCVQRILQALVQILSFKGAVMVQL